MVYYNRLRVYPYGVLEDAICKGLPSDEYFGIAGNYANDRYVDLKFNQTVFSVNQSDWLVKANVAMKQILAEKKEGEKHPNPWQPANPDGNSGGTSTLQPDGGNVPGTGGEKPQDNPPTPSNTRFFMSAKLDNTRVNRDVNNYLQEIIQHLMNVDGNDVELTLEVSVQAPNGIPSTTVRTVSENCRTLNVMDFGFEE